MSIASPIAAIYARYSTDEQRPTSIQDQVRCCRETAKALGLTVDENFVFTDSAISGTEKGRSKRLEYQRLLDAVKAGLVDVLIVDDLSRATRDNLEGAKLREIVENTGLRVVTSDGLDTAEPNWKTLWQIRLLSAGIKVENTKRDVVRGMLGQLERGYQVSQPPFGYRGVRDRASDGSVLGTRWVIDDTNAEVIRKMYAWRKSGMSDCKIAYELNAQHNILPPGHQRCNGKAVYWRPGTVCRIFANPIYKGIFVWNGSSASKAKAKKTRQVVDEREFARPNLGIVSSELWAQCNRPERAMAERSGEKNALSGVMHCGICNALLTVNKSKNSYSVHCPECEQANRVGGHQDFIGYSSLSAAKFALKWCLCEVFTGEILEEFQARLRARQNAGAEGEIADLKRKLDGIDVTLKRIKRLSLDPGIGEEFFKNDLTVGLAEQRAKRAQLDALVRRTGKVSEESVALQSSIDPLALIERLIEGEPAIYKVRATLRRLVTKFEFVAKPSKNVSVYELTIAPGVGVAEVTGTAVIDDAGVSFRVTLSTTARRPVVWEVRGERL